MITYSIYGQRVFLADDKFTLKEVEEKIFNAAKPYLAEMKAACDNEDAAFAEYKAASDERREVEQRIEAFLQDKELRHGNYMLDIDGVFKRETYDKPVSDWRAEAWGVQDNTTDVRYRRLSFSDLPDEIRDEWNRIYREWISEYMPLKKELEAAREKENELKAAYTAKKHLKERLFDTVNSVIEDETGLSSEHFADDGWDGDYLLIAEEAKNLAGAAYAIYEGHGTAASIKQALANDEFGEYDTPEDMIKQAERLKQLAQNFPQDVQERYLADAKELLQTAEALRKVLAD